MNPSQNTGPHEAPSSPGGPSGSSRPSARPSALRLLWPYVRPYRRALALALACLLAAALTTLAFPAALRGLVDVGMSGAAPMQRVTLLREHFLLLLLIGAGLGVFSAARFYMVTWLGERITTDLRTAVYRHLVHQSPAFFQQAKTGEVLSRLSADTTLVQTVVGSSFSMGLRNAVMGLGALAMLVWTNPKVMGMVLGVLLLVVTPAILAGGRVRKLSRDSQDRIADASAVADEVLHGIQVVQSSTREADEATRYGEANERSFQTALRRTRWRALLVAFLITASFAVLLWGLYMGTQAVIDGRMSAGTLSQTVVYVVLLVSSVAVLAEVYSDVLRAAGAMDRLTELLSLRSPIQEPSHPRPLLLGQPSPLVEFRHVRFEYPARPGHAVLHDFNLTIQEGETVALVGPSGAGKSTVLQLLLRFHDPVAGEVLWHGTPLPELPLAALRGAMGFVPQDAVIFSGSAADNIRYAKPQASLDEVRGAAIAAHADEFIQRLPGGYQTDLGERGVTLSGGQRQRVAIARAILKDAPLLLLDEATSALDTESERIVQQALEAAMAHRTTVVIAHRLSTVQRADRIVVLDQGRIVETGTHDALLAAGGLYRRLAAEQFGLQAS